MIRHMVLFSWKPEATEEQKQRVSVEIAKLPSIVPSIRAFASGPDAGLGRTNHFDFAVSVDFDDKAGLLAYRENPGHQDIVRRYIQPITAQRATVQFEF
jgi:hypothetical protein